MSLEPTLTDREEKIKRIYEVIADKSFKTGCDFVYNGYTYTLYKFWSNGELEVNGGMLQMISKEEMKSILDMGVQMNVRFDLMEEIIRKKVDVIGHKVMIGDVIYWIEKSEKDFSIIDGIEGDDCGNLFLTNKPYLLHMRQEKRKPLEEQSDECIEYVYSLIASTK